jgi:hypothetical protein
MQSQALIVVLTILMNTLGGITAAALFPPGSVGFIVVAIAGLVVGNTLALFGRPALRRVDQEEPKKFALPGEIAKVVLPFLFAGAMLSSGCGTAGGKALKACELGKLSATGQEAFATVHDLVDNPGSSPTILAEAALTLLPGQLDCAAKAVLAWLDSLRDPPAPDGASVRMALTAAHTQTVHEHARDVLREYLHGRPTSCRPVRVAQLEPCAEGAACRQVVIDGDVPESVR